MSEEAKKDAEEKPVFNDERGRPWTIKLDVPLAMDFIRAWNEEHPWDHEPMSVQRMTTLRNNPDALLMVAYIGSRHCSRAKAEPQTYREFLECINGKSWLSAQRAAIIALMDFFHLVRPETPATGAAVETATDSATNGTEQAADSGKADS